MKAPFKSHQVLKRLTLLPKAFADDRKLTRKWAELATRCQLGRIQRTAGETVPRLRRSAESDAPTAACFELWAGDDLIGLNEYDTALEAFGAAAERAGRHPPILDGVDVERIAIASQARAHAAMGNNGRSIELREHLYRTGSGDEADVEGMLLAGRLAEQAGHNDRAAEVYSAIADEDHSPRYVPAQLALRARQRLSTGGWYGQSLEDAVDRTVDAINDRDATALDVCVSRSHFVVGLIGGHMRFEDDAFRERMLTELLQLNVRRAGSLRGTGEKRYLFVPDAAGKLLEGLICLIFMRSARGWKCTGVGLSAVNDEVQERWRPHNAQTNQPLPFAIKAPWPSGDHFMAGGLTEFIVKSAAVAAAAAGSPFGVAGALLAGSFALSRCGYGTRGFYYNDSDTHRDEDAFAIDFTRYRRGVPFDNESGGTPVLAIAPGIIRTAQGGQNSGSSSASNTVEIFHADPGTGNAQRYLSRYLHLQGPNLPVSALMPVITGQRLGRMNDTGNSVLDHLHFSIHDQTVPTDNSSRGASVRPSPMDGRTLGDGDSGKCIRSSNVERRPPPPDDAEFVRQDVPASLRPFETGTASITMRNSGPNDWGANYKLVSLAPGWSVDSVTIGSTVASGDEITIAVPLMAQSSGDFDCEWRMSRPFGGLGQFGISSKRVTVKVSDGTGSVDCADLDQQIQGADLQIQLLQQQLSMAAPSEKAFIIDEIQRLQGEIAALNALKSSAGCP